MSELEDIKRKKWSYCKRLTFSFLFFFLRGGGDNMILRGNGGRISRRQRSIKGRTTYLFGSLKCNLNQWYQTAPKSLLPRSRWASKLHWICLYLSPDNRAKSLSTLNTMHIGCYVRCFVCESTKIPLFVNQGHPIRGNERLADNAN